MWTKFLCVCARPVGVRDDREECQSEEVLKGDPCFIPGILLHRVTGRFLLLAPAWRVLFLFLLPFLPLLWSLYITAGEAALAFLLSSFFAYFFSSFRFSRPFYFFFLMFFFIFSKYYWWRSRPSFFLTLAFAHLFIFFFSWSFLDLFFFHFLFLFPFFLSFSFFFLFPPIDSTRHVLITPPSPVANEVTYNSTVPVLW